MNKIGYMEILEKTEQIDQIQSNDIVLIPVFLDTELHPCATELSFLYVKEVNSNKSFIFPINHSEVRKPTITVEQFLDIYSSNKKYVLDKKVVDQIFEIDSVIDVSLLYHFNTSKFIETDQYKTVAHRLVERNFPRFRDLNSAIPILKHIEYYDRIADDIEKIVNSYGEGNVSGFDRFNDDVISTLSRIEKNGIYVDKKKFVSTFGYEYNRFVDKNSYIYSQYNLLTSTGRPSNRFGGINFAALNKEDGSRKPFKSRYGKRGVLVLFDFESYHPRLIANLLNYNIPNDTSVHEYLGKQYFNKTILNKEEYEESKSKTFQLLYGGIDKKTKKKIPYFKKVDEYTNSLWELAKKQGYIESPIYERKVNLKQILNPSKQKIFNYLLQLYETENSMEAISRVHGVIDDDSFESKVIMYTYDSILIDMKLDEGVGFIRSVKDVMEDGVFPVRVYIGNNYHTMKDVTTKL